MKLPCDGDCVKPFTHSQILSAVDTICIARQPILDRNKKLVAYELLFRLLDGHAAPPAGGLQITLSVIHNVLHGMGIEAVLGGLPGFINVDADFLMSDLVETLPTGQLVLEVLETVDPTSRLVKRIRELKRRGFKFALDDYVGDEARYAELLPEMDVFKVDLVGVPAGDFDKVVRALRRYTGRLLAEKVETDPDFRRTLAAEFDLYQGYHFARPETMSRQHLKSSAPTQLLKLLDLLTCYADTPSLVKELRRQPALSYNLIRIANSSAIGSHRKINSIYDAARLLGHRQLLHVLQVLLYAAQGGNTQSNPLLQMAVVRSKLMQDIASAGESCGVDVQEAAFMTGMLSLIDGLLKMPIEEVLAALHVPDEVRDALLHRSGTLGTLLKLCEHIEKSDDEGVKRELSQMPWMNGRNLMAMQLDAFSWGKTLGI